MGTQDFTGISLHFPEVNLQKNITISVEVIKNIEDYSILPRRYRLLPTVSAAYRITASDKLPAPVRVRIEHCAIHDREDSLVFLKSGDTPPYQFQPLLNGKFPLDKSYGEIEMNNFCTLKIIWSILGYRLRLALFVFYERNGGATIVVTKNEPNLVNAVKFEYRRAIDSNSTTISCDYTTKEISLNVPAALHWNIVPVFSTEIDLLDVYEYEPGKLCPKIELLMECKGDGEAKEEVVRIEVKGDKVTPINLWCKKSTGCQERPNGFTAGQLDPNNCDDLLRALEVLEGLDKERTKRLGLRLGLSPLTVNNTFSNSSEYLYHDHILSAWMNGVDDVNQKGGPSWNTLYNALEDEGMSGFAERVYQPPI